MKNTQLSDRMAESRKLGILGLKRCRVCDRAKPLDQFYPKGRRAGVNSVCKKCFMEWHTPYKKQKRLIANRLKEYSYPYPICRTCLKPTPIETPLCSSCKAKIRDVILRQAKHSKNPIYDKFNECNICGRKMQLSSHRTCIECVMTQQDMDRKERIRESRRKYAKSHREKFRIKEKLRESRKRGAIGRYTDDEWNTMLSICGNRCLNCGSTNDITVDHVVPIVLNGTNYISNLQPLCHACNSSKSYTAIIDYRLNLGKELSRSFNMELPQYSDLPSIFAI